MWEGSDVDFAVPMVEAAQSAFPGLRAASFDRGFHSPGNRVRLDGLLDDNLPPKKGCLDKADRESGRGEGFAAMRRRHPAVEPATGNLGHRGLDRILAQGAGGLARVVALSVVALNVRRIGLLLRRKARERQPMRRSRPGTRMHVPNTRSRRQLGAASPAACHALGRQTRKRGRNRACNRRTRGFLAGTS